jgi:predicted transcriptional regulator
MRENTDRGFKDHIQALNFIDSSQNSRNSRNSSVEDQEKELMAQIKKFAEVLKQGGEPNLTELYLLENIKPADVEELKLIAEKLAKNGDILSTKDLKTLRGMGIPEGVISRIQNSN